MEQLRETIFSEVCGALIFAQLLIKAKVDKKKMPTRYKPKVDLIRGETTNMDQFLYLHFLS